MTVPTVVIQGMPEEVAAHGRRCSAAERQDCDSAVLGRRAVG